MRRRDFITLLSGAAAWPVAARAQQADRLSRVGVLMHYAANQPVGQSLLAAFIQELRQLGWSEGQNLRLEVRWNAGDVDLAKIYTAQLIGFMPEVILAASTINLKLIQQATNSVPIVFVAVTDPVEQGIVHSLTHPGGNVTGFSNLESSIAGKWLDLLKEVAPNLSQVAVMFHPDEAPQSKFYLQAIEGAGRSLGVKATALPVRLTADIEPAFENFVRAPNGGLILLPGAFTRLHLPLIAGLAARHRLPSIGNPEEFAKSGSLMSYGGNVNDEFRGAAGYVSRILRGEKPADLPVQLDATFRLIINLKTAKAIGLDVPPSLLARADEVIE
jgi:putative ABC transport system substrate-binding protein